MRLAAAHGSRQILVARPRTLHAVYTLRGACMNTARWWKLLDHVSRLSDVAYRHARHQMRVLCLNRTQLPCRPCVPATLSSWTHAMRIRRYGDRVCARGESPLGRSTYQMQWMKRESSRLM